MVAWRAKGPGYFGVVEEGLMFDQELLENMSWDVESQG